ncbi:hypothetical protein ABK046_51320, partial [Streptomyces caeruleatus]
MNKRLSTQQKIEYFLHISDLSVLSISFYGGKYQVIYTNEEVTYTTKSKSISRAISELYKFYNE